MDVHIQKKKLSKTQKKKQAASAVVARVADRGIDGDLFRRFTGYVETIYDPKGYEGELAPCEHAHAGSGRKIPFDIPYTSLVNNEVVIFKMFPRLEDTIEAKLGASSPIAATTNAVSITCEAMLAPDTTSGLLGLNTIARGGNGGDDFQLDLEPATIGGSASLFVECATPAAAPVPFTIVNQGREAIQVRVYYRDTATLVWTGVGNLYYIPGGATIVGATAALANGSSGFSYLVRNGNASSTKSCKVCVYWNAANTSAASTTLTYPTTAWTPYSAIQQAQAIDEYRTTSMFMQLTCMGDMTTVGGRVAVGLVPREWEPTPGNELGSLAALPIGAWDGPLVDGAHIVWQPRTAEDANFQRLEQDLGAYYIIVIASLARAGTPIRLMAGYNCEIFSLDPALGAMSWCPSAFGLQEVLNAVFQAVPPGSSNDGHLKKKKGVLRIMQKLGGYSIDWLKKNPDQAVRMAKTIGALIL